MLLVVVICLSVSITLCVVCAIDVKNSGYIPDDQDRSKRVNRTELFVTDLTVTHAFAAVCLVVKNELDLREWVDYHHFMGIGKFYVFDHNSDVALVNSIKDFVESGVVEYSIVTKNSFPQMLAKHKAGQMFLYDECLNRYKDRHQFMAFIDSDEYIVVVDKQLSIIDVLRNYREYGGLSLNWRVFGTSGHKTRPPGGVLMNYRSCYPSFTIKTIVNSKFVDKCDPDNPHEFSFLDGKFAVDTNKEIVYNTSNPDQFHPPPFNSNLYDVMYINHYNTKSEEDCQMKVGRGTFSLYEHPNNYTAIVDAKAVHMCPPIRKPEKAFPLFKKRGSKLPEPRVPIRKQHH